MATTRSIAAGLIVLALSAAVHGGQPAGTAFLYQGQLKHSGAPVNDACAFEFRLFDAPTDGAQVGPALTFDGADPNPAPIQVVDGLFQAALDFGADAFPGDARFLQVAVRCPAAGTTAATSPGGGFTGLAPRQPLTPTPYAIRALIDETFGLPFEATIDRPEDAFSITNLGGIALVGATNESNTPAVKGRHTGNGQAGVFESTDATSTLPTLETSTNSGGAALRSANLGTGAAALVEVQNAANPSDALTVQTNGTGAAALIEIQNAANPSDALTVQTNGTGSAGDFDVVNPGSPAPALDSTTTGVGEAGSFEILNPASTASALAATTTGTGAAGDFSVTNTDNNDPALLVGHMGLGAGGLFVTGNPPTPPVPPLPRSTLVGINVRNEQAAGLFGNLDAENPDSALGAITLGRGEAGVFVIDNSDPGESTRNAADTIFAQTTGFGRAGFFEILSAPIPVDNGTAAGIAVNESPAIEATTDGNGPAARFSVTYNDSPSTTSALEVGTVGLGPAATFEVLSESSDAPSCFAATDSTGTGPAASFLTRAAGNTGTTLSAVNTGQGPAGVFNIQSEANPSTALTVTTIGTGSAAAFVVEDNESTENQNNAPALIARTLAFGSAARVEIDRPTTGTGKDPVNNSPALHVTTNASGQVARLESTSTEPVNPALEATVEGRGTAGRFAANSADNPNTALVTQTSGLGSAGSFEIFNENNSSAALFVTTNGTGPAATFEGLNASTTPVDTVSISANNTRHALFAQQTGAGEAAHFEIADPGNFNNAVFIKNNGQGVALSVENTNPNFAALALGIRGKSAFNGQVDILGPTGGPVPVNITGPLNVNDGNLTLTSGDLNVNNGQLCATSVCANVKSFRIDHPLDPQNKYLQHASVESAEMKNVYDGTVLLDEDGIAVVDLPDWFEALNEGFRYQLTPIGAPAPNLHIAEEISDGRFAIAGGRAGMKVSWQVTGVRKDAYARAHPLQVELHKPNARHDAADDRLSAR